MRGPLRAGPGARPAAPELTAFHQIEFIALAPDRPLIVTDADEVLFAFMASLERWLRANGYYYNWASYALFGNVRRRADDAPASAPEVSALLERFFADAAGNMDAVPDAAESLAALRRRAQIVVLSNIPHDRHADRRAALARHGMDYPLVSNSVGPKGPAVRALARRVRAPVFFIDDSKYHHDSVGECAARVVRLHMLAHPRLAALPGAVSPRHRCVKSWRETRAVIESELAAAGYGQARVTPAAAAP